MQARRARRCWRCLQCSWRSTRSRSSLTNMPRRPPSMRTTGAFLLQFAALAMCDSSQAFFKRSGKALRHCTLPDCSDVACGPRCAGPSWRRVRRCSDDWTTSACTSRVSCLANSPARTSCRYCHHRDLDDISSHCLDIRHYQSHSRACLVRII